MAGVPEACPDLDLQSPFANEEGRRVFQRMISEELSRNRMEEGSHGSNKSRRKKQRKKSKSTVEEDGCDETYYTPPESPYLSSEEESSTLKIAESEDFLRKIQTQSTKCKKKKRRDSKQEEKDFFEPLFQRLLSGDNPSTSDLDVPTDATLPTLTEMCLSVMLQNTLRGLDSAPPIIKHLKNRLKGRNDEVSARLLKWAWSAVKMHEKRKDDRVSRCYSEAIAMFPWEGDDLNSSLRFMSENSIHCCEVFTVHAPVLPLALYGDECQYRMPVQRALIHLVNQLFILCYHDFLQPKMEIIKKTVEAINKLLDRSCPKLMRDWKEFRHIWPAYVCWSKGWCKIAADLFAEAHSMIKDVPTKVLIYGELARMSTHYGDCRAAAKFLSHIIDNYHQYSPALYGRCNAFEQSEMPSSFYALQASVWDTGVMDSTSSAHARILWDRLMKSDWVPLQLALAAVESAFSIHMLKPSGHGKVHTPEEGRGPLHEWIGEVDQFLRSVLRLSPSFGYYLAFLHSMFGARAEANAAWLEYKTLILNDREQSNWCVLMETFLSELTPPWLNLAQTMTGRCLLKSPFLPLVWRCRLQWPTYQEDPSPELIPIGDHCSQDLNLRLTDGGYITADIAVDFPPLLCVLLDPLTGSLVYDKQEQLDHCCHTSSNLFNGGRMKDSDLCAPPQPVRLVTFGDIVVEYVTSHVWGISKLGESPSVKTSHASLNWYHANGRSKSLDILSIAKDHLKRSKHHAKKEFLNFLSHFILGKHTLVLFLTYECQSRINIQAGHRESCEFLMFVQFQDECSFMQPRCYLADIGYRFALPCPRIENVQAYPQRWLPHTELFIVLYKTTAMYYQKDKVDKHLVFDDSGNIVRECDVDIPAHQRRLYDNVTRSSNASTLELQHMLPIQATIGKNLYKYDSRITCETLDGIKCASLEVGVDQYYNTMTFPGTLMIVSNRKATFWDPITHSPLSLQRNTSTVNREEQDLSFQSDMVHCKVLRVWDISHPGERVFGCMAVLAFNDTLVVVERKVSCLDLVIHLHIQLPGYVYEYYPLGQKGHIVVSSVVQKRFREEMYWLNKEGRLVGVIPSLGCGPHSFLPLCPDKDGNLNKQFDDTDDHLLLYYADGHGGICCSKLDM